MIIWDKPAQRERERERERYIYIYIYIYIYAGQIKAGKRRGGEGVDNLQTDFHAYYTNDFMIFDVAGVGGAGDGSEVVVVSLALISAARAK